MVDIYWVENLNDWNKIRKIDKLDLDEYNEFIDYNFDDIGRINRCYQFEIDDCLFPGSNSRDNTMITCKIIDIAVCLEDENIFECLRCKVLEGTCKGEIFVQLQQISDL